jgi:hypothetical protein
LYTFNIFPSHFFKIATQSVGHTFLYYDSKGTQIFIFFAQMWFDGAAEKAQSWAKKCLRGIHDQDRNINKTLKCGQNIYTTSGATASWSAAVDAWKGEVSKYTYGSTTNELLVVGHYTQVVWATSNMVGCGIATCKDARGPFINLVCNYCPP